MKNRILTFLLFILVKTCLTLNSHYFGQVEPFTPDDFNEKPDIDSPGICHSSNMKCLENLKPHELEVCAYVRNEGLIDFDLICSIYLENCERQTKAGRNMMYSYGVRNDDDLIYHNGLMHDCKFYFKMAKNGEHAVQIYFEAGAEGPEYYVHEGGDMDPNILV
ncbi:unnamed protein product [Spodoptera littoralis]|uniref:Uncharacterized protein n=1 Tax=Spodoptera littoralis TaxID=7109 RepID=A0A9P0I7U2_SPOLI|nr:unnamed protein product [Spodoptera littoralis]CAH1641573.1 unnamed protein product [Spodoptera littoralis]